MKLIQDGTLGELHRLLGQLAKKASVVGSNIANVETPGYRAQEAHFREPLRGFELEMRRSAGSHLDPGRDLARLEIRESAGGRPRADGNNVDIDKEMTQLAKVSGRYTAVALMVRKRFALIRYAATDGR